MKHIDVRVALIFNPLPCNKVLSSVNTTYFLFLPSRMKANIDQTCRSIYVCVSSSESQRKLPRRLYWAPRRLDCPAKAPLQSLRQPGECPPARAYGAKAFVRPCGEKFRKKERACACALFRNGQQSPAQSTVKSTSCNTRERRILGLAGCPEIYPRPSLSCPPSTPGLLSLVL